MLKSGILSTLIFLNINVLSYLDIFNNKAINDFINKYGYDIPVIAILFVGIVSLSLLLSNKFISLNHDLKQNYYDKFSEEESMKKEYHLYFLFVGIGIIISELVFESFNIRSRSTLLINIIIGCLSTISYYVLSEVPALYRHIKLYFMSFFFLYFLYICFNLVHFSYNTIPSMGFIIIMFFSYNVIKPTKYYYYFVTVALLFLLVVLFFKIGPIKNTIIVLNFSILTIIINQIRHIVFSNVKDKLQFTNEIVEKGNSLVIAWNKKGECLYCSDSIKSILGYNADEVKGMEYWRLTNDPDFIGEKYFENHDENRIYTRKLKSKNGEDKYIQWKEKRLEEDIIIGMGQDITKQYILKNQFKNLIQTASDLIFEMDQDGHFIFVNNFALQILDLSESEIIGQHYNQFVSPKYQKLTTEFYENLNTINTDLPFLEIPLLKKNGQEIWVSQKVIIRKNENGDIIGYSGIGRDITKQKNNEDLKEIQLNKIKTYNEIVKKLCTANYNNFSSERSTVNYILKEATLNTEIHAITFWDYNYYKIKCKFGFSTGEDFKPNKKGIIRRKDFPVYFESIENKSQLIVLDVLSKYETSEFEHDYLDESGVKSLIDSAVYVNGDLVGIVCFESKTEKKWDTEDSNFAKSISEIISLGIATQKRLKNEKKLRKKSNLLSALALCTEKFLSSKTITEMLEETFEIMGKASEADHMFYYEKDELSGLISQQIKWCKKGIEKQSLPLLQFYPHELSEIMEHVQKKTILNILTSDLQDSILKNLLLAKEIKCILILPIYVNEDFIGFIGVDNCKKAQRWKKDDLYILQTLVNNISSLLEKVKSEKQIAANEAKFKLIANIIPGTIYLAKFDSFSTKIFLNDEIEKLTGYKKSDFSDNIISFLNLIHPEERDSVITKQQLDLQARKSIHSKYRIKKKSGEYVWIEEYASVVKRDNEIEYIGGLYSNINKI